MKKLRIFHLIRYEVVVLFFVPLIFACSSGSDSGVSNGEGGSFRPVRIDVDRDNDGSIDRTFNLIYGTQGLLTAELIDNNVDGNYDDEIAYLYDDGEAIGANIDFDRDGTINQYIRYSYDGSGIVLAQTNQETLNGPLTSRIDYLQNASGVLTGANVDDDADGSIDEVTTYRFNSNGSLEEIEFDTDFDDITDIAIQFDYDQFGGVLTRTRRLADNSTTSVWTYIYEEGPCDPVSERQPRIATCVLRP